MRTSENIHVCVTGEGVRESDGLIAAMRSEGWDVSVLEDIGECLNNPLSSGLHMIVVISPEPELLPTKYLRGLMKLHAEMSVVYLVPEHWREEKSRALAGVTFDQIHRVSSPVSVLMEVFQDEVRSVLYDQAQYIIMCVDDDKAYLSSLKSYLPAHLRAISSRYDLDIEFYDDAREAIDACEHIDQRQLAVVVSDQVMPNITGIDFLSRVKELHPNTKRVLMTGQAGLESAVSAINRQVLHKYIFKPVEPVDLSESLRLLLSEQHLERCSEARRNQMMAQYEYIRTITAARNIDEVLRNTEICLTEQLRPTSASIALMRDGELYIQSSSGIMPGMSAGSHISTEIGVWSWLYQNRRMICTSRREDLPEGFDPSIPLPIIAAPLIRESSLLGIILLSGRDDGKNISRDERIMMSFVADAASVAIGSFKDREAVESSYVSTMASLMETVEAKDSYTRGHTERVMTFATELAKAVGVTGQILEQIKCAAALHDIGKIALPDAILLKATSLTSDEYAIVKEHPIRADRILQHLRYMDGARIMVRGHHEAYNGKGYPDGLAGEEIPLGARILAIVDSYDAMTSARSYRNAMKHEEALEQIEINAGTQFDPRLVAIFLDIMRTRGISQPDAIDENLNISMIRT